MNGSAPCRQQDQKGAYLFFQILQNRLMSMYVAEEREGQRERCEKLRSPTCDLRDPGSRDSPVMMGGHSFLPEVTKLHFTL